MAILDIILLIILGGFVLFGLWFGLIHTLGALLGTVVGAWIAGHYYISAASWLSGIFGDSNTVKIVSFIIIFMIANRLIGLIFYILDRVFRIVSIIPFLKTINRLAGAILGFLEGILVIGVSLFVMSRYPLGDWFTNELIVSPVAHWLIVAAKLIVPLLPEVIRQLKAII
jgi:membrane protein required for colicin V production